MRSFAGTIEVRVFKRPKSPEHNTGQHTISLEHGGAAKAELGTLVACDAWPCQVKKP